jgi:hypothetical protein
MAQVSLLKRVSAYLQNINEATDQPLVSTLEGTLATRSLWADAAATTVNLATGTALTTLNVGTGAAVTAASIATGAAMTTLNVGTGMGAGDTITVGGTGSSTIVAGDLTVNGTTTTINSTTLNVADRFITCAFGAGGNVSGGFAVSQVNGASNDLLFMWNEVSARAEVGLGDASTNPAGVSSFSPVKVSTLLLAGTAVTADAALTVTATAATLTLAATGSNPVAIATNSLTRFTATSDGAQEFVGLAANPAVSTASNGRIYYNSTANELRVSYNTGAYTTLSVGTPTLSSVLAAGNTTGANNIVISAGQSLQSASGSDLTLESQGATEQITFRTNATNQWAIDESGDLLSLTTNNIGNVGQTASPTTVYAATSVVVGTTTTLTTNALTGSGALTVSATAATLTLQTTTSGSIFVTSASGLFLSGAGSWNATSGTISMTTTTSGAIALTSAGATLIDALSGFSIDGLADSNVSTTSSNLTISTITSGTLSLTSAQSFALSGTGVASSVSSTSAALMIRTLTSGTLSVTSVATLDMDGVLVTIDAGVSGFSIDSTGASNVSTTAADLTVSTITSGTLAVTSAGVLDMDGTSVTIDATGAVSIDAATASNFTVSGGTADLTLGARAATITLNEVGQTTLTGFTATSIIGALNELAGAQGAQINVPYTNANAGTITLGQCVYISTTNSVNLAVATSDVAAARIVGFVQPSAGIATTATGDIAVEGRADARFVAGLTLTPGDEVYLSLTAGSVTDDISAFTTGNVIQLAGYVKSLTPIGGGSAYDGGANLVAQIQVQWGGKIVL